MNGPKRVGRFIIGDIYPLHKREEDAALRAIFAQCVVLRAEYNVAKQGIEYIALSPHFDEVDDSKGSLFADGIPEYEWILLRGCTCGHTTTRVEGVRRIK